MYKSIILELLTKYFPETEHKVDPRWIEALIRVEHPTLDHLSVTEFIREIEIALVCVRRLEPADVEELALSYGL